jgi:hypothetical protein
MMMQVLDDPTVRSELRGAFEQYISGWGPVVWRTDLAEVSVDKDETLARVFRALADVEDDSLFMRRKLARVGILRNKTIEEFTIAWSAEESEHSRALTKIASLYGIDKGIGGHGLRARDRRSALGSLVANVARLYPSGMTAAYLSLGVAQEYTALTIYNYLAGVVTSSEVAEVLRRLARQEGRHMRFYRVGAECLLEGRPRCQAFVRGAMEKFWRPVGIDLLGYERWLAAFGPYISQPAFRADMVGMDRAVGNLQGMLGIQLMEPFLAGVRA